ncbi:MAG: phosphoribosylamine--glycine ligase [Chloroflexi bacterium]|nr:phosphoribosylamine--glycine ligase [Chloroflexota bacterium]
MNVLIVGAGGREHALAWKLAHSPRLGQLYVAPGNAGTGLIAHNLSIPATDIEGLTRAAKDHRIDLVVVGPEAPLAAGLVDSLAQAGIAAFGPGQQAARLESSKVFARMLMEKYGIPCPRGMVFSRFEDARDYVKSCTPPVVVKADGLAAGKGVVVAQSTTEALEALSQIMQARAFGDAGNQVIIDECLSGPEASLVAFTDGRSVLPLVPACDYKRAYDNDQGPNTGGMGSYSPPEFFDSSLLAQVQRSVLEPTVRALAQEGIPYKGVLYAGLMLTREGPRVLEFNVRFGDPETQVTLPQLKTDLLDIMLAVRDGTLGQMKIEWSDRACVGVVLASGGYPGSYRTGLPIAGLDSVDRDVLVFHSGTRADGERVTTSGGRVLTVVACGDSLAQARDMVYSNVPRIGFEGCFYRKDIAARALGRERKG